MSLSSCYITHHHTQPSVAFGSSKIYADDTHVAYRNLVLSVVANTFCVRVRELRAATRRRKHIALARQVAMYLTHVAGGITLSDVGRLYGRDRTTAAHACRVVEDLRDDPEVDHVLGRLESILDTMDSYLGCT